MLPRIDFCSTDAYKALLKHFEQIKKESLRDLFRDPKRFEQFSISFGDILLDYSKNRINSDTHDLLLQLAEECGLKDAIRAAV
jgi:glucose-6-phosphate isomerase